MFFQKGLNICLLPGRFYQLWKILLRQLNIGDAKVKRSSLDLMTVMLKEKCIRLTNVS